MGGAPSTIFHDPAGLLLGGVDAVRDDSDFLQAHRVAGVVSVCDERPSGREGLDILHINIEDSTETELAPRFLEASAFIHKTRVGGGTVYIHCTAGISRSTTIATAYMMATLGGLTRDEAIGHLHRCRETVCPNEGFLAQLDAFEGEPAAAAGKELAAIAAELGKTEVARKLQERDLMAVAKSLRRVEEKARAYEKAAWFYRADATPVPEHLIADIHDSADGNGPKVDGRMVRPRDGDDYGTGAVNFGLVSYKKQRRKLRKLLRQRKREAGGSVGLEWLLDPGDDVPHQRPPRTKTWDGYKAWLAEQRQQGSSP